MVYGLLYQVRPILRHYLCMSDYIYVLLYKKPLSIL